MKSVKKVMVVLMVVAVSLALAGVTLAAEQKPADKPKAAAAGPKAKTVIGAVAKAEAAFVIKTGKEGKVVYAVTGKFDMAPFDGKVVKATGVVTKAKDGKLSIEVTKAEEYKPKPKAAAEKVKKTEAKPAEQKPAEQKKQ